MDNRLIQEMKLRREKCILTAADRGFHSLLIIGKGPERTGDLKYLANHSPMLPGHPRRYDFRGRGYSFLILPVNGSPTLAVTTPFYEDDVAIDDVQYANNLIKLTAKIFEQKGLKNADIGIVGTDILPAALYWDLKKELNNVKFYHADDIVMNLRARKSPVEIEMMRKGAQIADNVVKGLKKELKPGVKECDIGNYICTTLTEFGVTGAFATCQSGKRSMEPYNLNPCSDKVIENGDMVHMEVNGFYNGYMIDVCRSTVVGDMSKEQEKILNICCEMLDRSTKAVRMGIRAEELEFITTEIAERYGLAANHTATTGGPGTYLGHAIGLGVDEPPCLAKGDLTILQPGMVLTIEPGIYRTKYGGCRIEDEVLVTETGYEVLNTYGKRLWEE